MAHSRSFLANRKARNAIVWAENLLKTERKKGKKKERMNEGKRNKEKKEREKKPEKT